MISKSLSMIIIMQAIIALKDPPIISETIIRLNWMFRINTALCWIEKLWMIAAEMNIVNGNLYRSISMKFEMIRNESITIKPSRIEMHILI
jgi:hypothetical protein